jgi:hypothetical protein
MIRALCSQFISVSGSNLVRSQGAFLHILSYRKYQELMISSSIRTSKHLRDRRAWKKNHDVIGDIVYKKDCRGLARVLTQVFLAYKAHDGVLCTFSTRTSATTAWLAKSSQLSSSRPGQAVRYVREWHGPCITAQLSPGWVTLLQPARQASVSGHLSRLWPHCCLQYSAAK